MSEINFLVLDIDGTLTDGKVYMAVGGEVLKAFNIKDGCGIVDVLPRKKIVPVVITGRSSKIVSNRCVELGIKYVFQGERNKLACLRKFIDGYNAEFGTEYSLKSVAYIGDDLPDLFCMEAVKTAGGIAACPADAVIEVKELCDFISSKNGGDGAVRDLIDWL